LLFQIDDRPYATDLNQAEANYRLAVADRNLMEKNAERARRLWASKSMAREDVDTAIAAFEKAGAAVVAADAAREKAQLYLNYTRVLWEQDKPTAADKDGTRAPMTGRISRRFVDPGNLVLADNTVLTTIVTENPMYAYFDVDERTYLDLLATSGMSSATKAREAWASGARLPVLMRLANETEFEKDKVGFVDFIDNRVIANTGTVRMRGVFQNPTGLLKAGLFVRIRLPIGAPYDAVLIPDEAVQNDQERKYVFVVNAKNEVEYRSVKLGQPVGDLRVIRPPEKGKEGKEGLTREDRVLIAGMQRVRNGSQVEVEEKAPPAPPGMALVRLLKKNGN
jgi:RND family efflux transporter MFP subunit